MTDKTPLISTPLFGEDFELFKDIVNQGIDARLEAFTKSEFRGRGSRFEFHFHKSEYPLLLKRLSDRESDLADGWLTDLVQLLYRTELL